MRTLLTLPPWINPLKYSPQVISEFIAVAVPVMMSAASKWNQDSMNCATSTIRTSPKNSSTGFVTRGHNINICIKRRNNTCVFLHLREYKGLNRWDSSGMHKKPSGIECLSKWWSIEYVLDTRTFQLRESQTVSLGIVTAIQV